MSDDGKTALLNAAAIIGEYYAYLAEALRRVYDPGAAAQVSEEQFDARLGDIRAALAPILERNRVVQENLESIDRTVTRIRKEAQGKETRAAALQEAQKFYSDISQRARTVSDLVGLFRRL